MRRTGHIRERSSGSWEIRFSRDGKTRTATIRGTRKEADRELRRRRAAIAVGLARPSRPSVRQTTHTPVCTRADGSRIGPNAITVDFWRLAKRLGLGVHYHSLRHGHATALLLARVHPKVALGCLYP